jgi:capsular polysaccharide transport system permease protein
LQHPGVSMPEARNPLSVAFSVWHAIFLREALDRLFDMRGAWFWMLLEPVFHIGFMTFIFSVIRLRTIGNVDIVIWIIVGMLSFFLWRRTATQVTYAIDSNRPLFTYRQVKLFDAAIVRAVLELFVMAIVSVVILLAVALLGHEVFPGDPLLAMQALAGLWLFGIGYGLVASVLMELVPEMEHILKMIMMPLYLISGVIFPLAAVPQPYRDLLMINPIAHGLELARKGFAPNYQAVPETSASYLFAWVLTSIFLGLVLYRRFAFRLVMK